MKEQTIICTVCPIGCRIHVSADDNSITRIEGYMCKRGKKYARNEFTNPVRILTSSAFIEGGKEPLVPIRSDRPLPKNMLFDCMREIRALYLKAPIELNTVVIENILGTGANIITSNSVKEETNVKPSKDYSVKTTING